jgi:hypothetical protein
MDGTPTEMLRFQRDVLGCRVLTFTDHWHLMNQREVAHTLDRLEEEAGDGCVVLYGAEVNPKPRHHTNFYMADREIAERFLAISRETTSRVLVYHRLRSELPEGAIVALRHFHGPRATGRPGDLDMDGDTIRNVHDPVLEVAMEAMQNRGCPMFDRTPRDRGLPLFPTNFLNAGARVGLVAGSDHNGGVGINHYCLTGFWVDDLTPEAVWQALVGRRTIAAENGKVAVWAEYASGVAGDIVRPEDGQKIRVRCAAPRPIRRIGLMHNRHMHAWQDVTGTEAEVDLIPPYFADEINWLSVVVEADSAYPDAPVTAIASPFFVDLPPFADGDDRS